MINQLLYYFIFAKFSGKFQILAFTLYIIYTLSLTILTEFLDTFLFSGFFELGLLLLPCIIVFDTFQMHSLRPQ